MSRLEAAVERGARVLIEDGRFGVPWDDASEEDQAETKDRVRAILEAALGGVEVESAAMERATEAARSYAENWCADFAEVIALGPRFDEHMEAIARTILEAQS